MHHRALVLAEYASLSGGVDIASIDLMSLTLRWENEPNGQSALLWKEFLG